MHRRLAMIVACALTAQLCCVVTAQAKGLPRQLSVVTKRFLVECPPGTKRSAKSLRRNSLQQRVSIEQPTWEVRCVTPGGMANGPAVRVRHSYRANRVTLSNRAFFLARQLVWAGAYSDGARDGLWQQFNRRGQALGEVHLDRGNGVWKAWRSDGQLAARGPLKNDLESGKWRFWYARGVLALEGRFERGAREGRWQRYNFNGTLHSDVSYRAGHRDGLSTDWFPSGEKRVEGTYKRGKRDGEWAYWNPRGELLGINSLKDGSGQWMQWRDNGELRSSGWLKNGARHGHWKFFRSDGQLAEEGDYRNGSRQRSTWKRYNAVVPKKKRRANARSALRRASKAKILNLLGRSRGPVGVLRGGTLSSGRAVGGVAMSGSGSGGLGMGRGFGRVGGIGGRSSKSRTKFRMPKVQLVVRSGNGVSLSPVQLRRTTALIRFCSMTFDIKRLRKAASNQLPQPPPMRDAATVLVSFDSRGKTASVKVTRQGKLFDIKWHRCMLNTIKKSRFSGVSATPTQAEVDVIVK